MRSLALVVTLSAAATLTIAAQQPRGHEKLFPPQNLGLLEAPDRDVWQRSERVMDALGIVDASVVADVGAGSGWFTVRLARRVGPQGLVYAQDVQQEMLIAIERRVKREGLANVRPVLGRGSDPRLPAGTLDAVLLVDAYHEIVDRVPFLARLSRALKPDGRLGIIDFKLGGGGPGPPPDERVGPEVVEADAARAGLRLHRSEAFLPFQYFLVFGRNDGTRQVPSVAARP